MDKDTTAQRLKYIMNSRNLRQVDILNLCKPYCEKYGVRLEKGDLSLYVSGKVQPNQVRLTILGMALNVSEAWLMGFDVPMERKPVVSHNGRSAEFSELFSRLTPEQQDFIIASIKGLLQAQE